MQLTGYFLVSAIIWGRIVDKKSDKYEILGSMVTNFPLLSLAEILCREKFWCNFNSNFDSLLVFSINLLARGCSRVPRHFKFIFCTIDKFFCISSDILSSALPFTSKSTRNKIKAGQRMQ